MTAGLIVLIFQCEENPLKLQYVDCDKCHDKLNAICQISMQSKLWVCKCMYVEKSDRKRYFIGYSRFLTKKKFVSLKSGFFKVKFKKKIKSPCTFF